MPSVGGFEQPLLLDAIFGAQIGQVRTQINAGTAAQTAINTGSVANGGASGNMDTTPANNSLIVIGHPGSGSTQNQYSTFQAFIVTSSTATVMTIASQTVNFQLSVGDPIFLVGTTTSNMAYFLNTLYFHLSTATWSATITDASLKAGEPTTAGNYLPLGIATSTTIWPNSTGPSSGISTIKNATSQSMATSTAAWSTTTTPLASGWFDDSNANGGHDVIWSGALSPATDIVNGTGVTFTFASNALQATLQ